MVAALCGAAYWPVQAGAEDAVPPQVAANPDDLLGSSAVGADALSNSRGGADVNLYDIKSNSDGVVSNNQASNLTTGSNWITDGSLAGASGFSTVVQNSGNNVLIQNATIINLQVQ